MVKHAIKLVLFFIIYVFMYQYANHAWLSVVVPVMVWVFTVIVDTMLSSAAVARDASAAMAIERSEAMPDTVVDNALVRLPLS